MIESSRAYQYAKWCTQRGNQKVGRYVKLQAKAWLKIADGKHKEAYVSEPAYRKICRLLGLMVHPDLHCTMDKGLEDYAWFLIVAVFCTLRREDDRRFYETALLEIARKNFKTFNSAVIFIIGLLTEPRFSRFFSVAPDYKLSSELRLAVRKIIKVSPALVKHFKVTRDMITCLVTETEYMPLAYSNDGMDGRLANIFLADEAGALDSYPVEAMRSSQITLANKLGIIISTQYPNDNNVLTDEIDIAKKVLDRVLDRENVFSLLYEPDDALRKQWETNDLVLYQANPVAVNNTGVLRAIKICAPWRSCMRTSGKTSCVSTATSCTRAWVWRATSMHRGSCGAGGGRISASGAVGGSGWAWIWRSLTITQPYPWSRSRATCFTLRHGALSRLGGPRSRPRKRTWTTRG